MPGLQRPCGFAPAVAVRCSAEVCAAKKEKSEGLASEISLSDGARAFGVHQECHVHTACQLVLPAPLNRQSVQARRQASPCRHPWFPGDSPWMVSDERNRPSGPATVR